MASIATSGADSPTKPLTQSVEPQPSHLPPLCWLAPYRVSRRLAGLSRTFRRTFARSANLNAVFSNFSSSGYETCDGVTLGLSNIVRIIIGISICNSPFPACWLIPPADQPHSPHSRPGRHRPLVPARVSQAPVRSDKPSLPPPGSPRTRCRTTAVPGQDVR